MSDEYIYCDDCGDWIKSSSAHHYSSLPCDVSSANAGESASVCAKCDRRIEADSNSKHFKSNHR